jgi:hypothetical protein
MFKERVIAQMKQHRYATAIFVLYMAFWVVVYCLLFGGLKVGEVALYAMFLSIPYSLIMLLMSLAIKNSNKFFLWLTFIIYIPIIVTFIIILPLV